MHIRTLYHKLLYFVWARSNKNLYCIFHTEASVLCGNAVQWLANIEWQAVQKVSKIYVIKGGITTERIIM